jgi:hypothetical protein
MMAITDPIYRSLEIVEVVCIVSDPTRPTYRINGMVQRAGDRCRLSRVDAENLVNRGKARIVEGSEKTVMM